MNISKRQKWGGNRLAIAFTALALGLAAATNAAELADGSITVRYGDLRIETEQGAAVLLRRIQRAAERVCEPLEYGTAAKPVRAKACRLEATAAAVSKVDHPMLQAVYNSAKGVRPPVASLGR
jgi:UrcA family protein